MSIETIPSFAAPEEVPPSEKVEVRQEKELSPEAEAMMEHFRGERAGLLAKIANRKTAEAALLLAPGLDVVTLAAFAVRGETLTGNKLDGTQRLNHAAIAGFLGVFYALQLAGMHKEALAARGAAATLGAIEFGPDLFEKTKKLAQERMPAIRSFMENTGVFLKNKIQAIKDTHQAVLQSAEADPNFTFETNE